MFETAELGQRVDKATYKSRVPPLREALLMAQQRLRQVPFPVVVLFAGVDGAGKGSTVNLLNEWMDPRWIVTRALGKPTQDETERPPYWRYWRDLPPKGSIGLFLSAWYSSPILKQAHGETTLAELDHALDEIMAFEQILADDGALVLKFWMHLGKDAQERRLKKLEKDPLESWRVTKTDWKHWKMYDAFVQAAERTIMRSSTGDCPWHIIEGEDERYRSLRVGELLLDALTRKLDAHEEKLRLARKASIAPVTEGDDETRATPIRGHTVLDGVDLTASLEKKRYERALKEAQARLNLLHRKAREKNLSTVLVFEGWDAAGKGGAIRRLTAALDARAVRVIPIAAPTDEERAQHYLWRFWRHMSRVGRVTIFDRSWYGRVLVERVEGFARPDEWRRAYAEINHFEKQLVDHGVVLVKFWLHIDQDEQARRFEERAKIPYKRWKLTDEDWRNREKWPDYELAVHDMVERTSTYIAPWQLIAANDKKWARIKVLETVSEKLEAKL